jgi:hypothetical protein
MVVTKQVRGGYLCQFVKRSMNEIMKLANNVASLAEIFTTLTVTAAT